MDHLEFARRLEQRSLPSVLFFEGPEEHLKQTALQNLRRALLPEGMEELNESRLNAPETDELIAAAETLPFMADQRLILLRDHPAATGRAEADDRLLEYLPQAPSTAVIVFYCVQPVRQKKIKNAVQKLGGLVEFKPLTVAALTSFITDAFHQQGRECDARTADLLIFIAGADTNRLLNEVAKISAYHPEEPRVSAEDIQALAVPTSESKVFSLVDAILAGQAARAFSLLESLLLSGETRTMILFMLMRQFRLMQHIKIMQYEKRTQQQMMDGLSMNPYAFRQLLRQASGYNGRQVKEAVALCLDTDYQVKSGRLREEGAVESVMLRLLQLKKPAGQQ